VSCADTDHFQPMSDSAPRSGAAAEAGAALFRAAPLLEARLPRIAIGRYPTAVERHVVAGRELLIKRDDGCATGYGGNKVRKLEFLLGAARQRGARRLITAGATGSHHALATAYHGRRHGFAATLVLFPQRRTQHVRDILLMDAAVGAELRWVRRMEAVPFGLWRARVVHRADAPFMIPPGGSNEVGTLGYVSAGLELAEQVAAGVAPRPSRVHVAAGTLGTAAGLAIGLAWAGLPIPIVATRITSRIVTNERILHGLIDRTVRLLGDAGADPPPPQDALRLVDLRHDQIGTGYGHETPAGERALRTFAEAGLRLDATYTAKAAAGLLADEADGLPLFWHTLSSVEPTELIGRFDPAALPEPFARYIDGEYGTG
jgi:D-cysteine desulfhydrase